MTRAAAFLADAQLPSDVTEHINILGGTFLWLINILAVVCIVGAGGLFWLEKIGLDVRASPWLLKILISVIIAGAASDIAVATLRG